MRAKIFTTWEEHLALLRQAKGQSNAQSLFHLEDIPSDNHIRQTLDPVPSEPLFACYDAVLVAPGHPHAIPLRPEFITPQDGHTKQDCEIAASKRWLEKNAAQYAPLQAILRGDDLYAHQPFCRRALLHGLDFLFVCKPDSHTTLYQWVGLLQRPDLGTLTTRVKAGAHFHTFLSFTDANYRLIRATLPNRKTFFDDLRALTQYLHFPNWDALMDFMMRGLEIGPYARPP